MEVEGALFSATLQGVFGVLYLIALGGALRLAPWSKLRDSEQLHVFFGSVVALALLWHLRASVGPGLTFHLLGVTAVTLMFGWSLGIIAASLALVGVTLNGGFGWDSFLINAVTTGVLPVTLSQVLLVVIRWYLPRYFFVYVLVNGFLTAGLVAMVSGYLVTGLLVLSGAYSFAELSQSFLPFFPLMFLPEAMLNGWILTVLVLFRPNWVYSFSDEQYLNGK
jgi:uncharacterized membrane protein